MFLAIKSIVLSIFEIIATNIMEFFGKTPMFDFDYSFPFKALFAAIETILGL